MTVNPTAGFGVVVRKMQLVVKFYTPVSLNHTLVTLDVTPVSRDITQFSLNIIQVSLNITQVSLNMLQLPCLRLGLKSENDNIVQLKKSLCSASYPRDQSALFRLIFTFRSAVC